MTFIIFNLISFILIFSVIRWSKKREVELWNNSICPECNTKWESFDCTSQGDVGYMCQCQNYHKIWLSYNTKKLYTNFDNLI